MNKLRIIHVVIAIFKHLALVGAFFAILFFFYIPNDRPTGIGNPCWLIQDNGVVEQINSMVPHPNNTEFESIRLNMVVPLSPTLKWLITLFITIVSAYFFILLHFSQQIVKGIISGDSFTHANIRRIKMIGILIALSMPGEKFLAHIGDLWFIQNYSFDGLKVISETHLGWHIVIVGALIFALGVSFEQGLKLKEEQELTI